MKFKKTILTFTALLMLAGISHGKNFTLSLNPFGYGELDRNKAKEILISIGNRSRELKLLEEAEEVKILANTMIIKVAGGTYTFNVTKSKRSTQANDEKLSKLEQAQNFASNKKYHRARALYKELDMYDIVDDLYRKEAGEMELNEKYAIAAIILDRGGYQDEARFMYEDAAVQMSDKENHTLAAYYFTQAGLPEDARIAKRKIVPGKGPKHHPKRRNRGRQIALKRL